MRPIGNHTKRVCCFWKSGLQTTGLVPLDPRGKFVHLELLHGSQWRRKPMPALCPWPSKPHITFMFLLLMYRGFDIQQYPEQIKHNEKTIDRTQYIVASFGVSICCPICWLTSQTFRMYWNAPPFVLQFLQPPHLCWSRPRCSHVYTLRARYLIAHDLNSKHAWIE